MNIPAFQNRFNATYDGQTIHYSTKAAAQNALRPLWSQSPAAPPSQPAQQTSRYSEISELAPQQAPAPPPSPAPYAIRRTSRQSQEWLLGFAKKFSKDIESIDRKLQGRI